MPSLFHLSPASLLLSCLPLWTRSFSPPPLLSLHLASFPCLPPTPSLFTWLCWLPLHLFRVLPPGPCTFIPQLQPPAPTSPALAACSCASSAPCDLHLHLHPQTLSPYHGGKHGSGTSGVPAGVLHPYQKSFSPFSHLSLHVCPTLSHHLAPSICFMKGGHWGF